MRKNKIKSIVSCALATLVATNMLSTTALALEGNDYYNGLSKLMITELLPDSDNVNSKDGYEFIEVYNNTDKEVNIKDYKIIYRYPASDNKSDIIWDLEEDKVIGAQETFVVWIKNSGNKHLTNADFNSFFGTNLPDNRITTISCDGMANTAERTLMVATDDGEVLSSTTYIKDDVTADKGIDYAFSDTIIMTKSGMQDSATPGGINEGQVPEVPVSIPDIDEPDTNLPQVEFEHTPQQGIAANGLDVELNINSNVEVGQVKLFYKQDKNLSYSSVDMDKTEDGKYKASVASKALWSDNLTYYFTVAANEEIITSEEYTTTILGNEVDYSKVSPLLITELVPDSTNVNGADGYEFIEVYNNSDSAINFKDYKLRYRYPMDGTDADLTWASVPEDVVIEPGQTLVFWIINAKNGDKTVADFNKNYKTNLVENKDIVKVYSDGMANGSNRGVALATNTGNELTSVYYNDEVGITDSAADKGIIYKYHAAKGLPQTKVSSKVEFATPGSVLQAQVPKEVVSIKADNENPAIDFNFDNQEISPGEDYVISFKANDNGQVKTAELFYRTNKESEFRKEYIREKDGSYNYTIYYPELIGAKYLEYYIQVSDGNNTVKTEVYKAEVEQTEKDDTRVNIEDNQFISNDFTIKASDDKYTPEDLEINIDGKKVTDTYKAIEDTAYFAFDVNKTNIFFQNAVCIGDEILEIMDDTINGYITMTVPIDASRMKLGEALNVDIRSGTKVSPFDEESTENRDDFYVKNVRLILEDGTVIRDDVYGDESKQISVGDGANAQTVVSFNFNIAEEKFNSLATDMDTTAINDGKHKIEVVTPDTTIAKEFVVDNTAPEIKTNIEEGKKYKGEFTIEATSSDALSGVSTIKATLNGDEIKLPYTTSSATLSAGTHILEVTSVDNQGNKAVKEINFIIGEEHPGITVENDLVNNKTYITIVDEDGDKTDLDIYGGYKYSGTQLNVVSNAVDVEPPKEVSPEGETAITDGDYSNISYVDNEYLTTSSYTQFPYHKFTIDLDEGVDENDEIELKWQGKSKEGRKVTMYVWNNSTNEWDKVVGKVAGTEDFTLEGIISDGEYINNNQVNVMVQDEISIPDEEKIFTMAWMSDTQYYSQSYPYIYEKQVEWLAENKDELNLKYVFHTGDIVDKVEQEYQWIEADKNMKILEDADIPYGVLAGNHDVGHKDGDYEMYSKYFGEDRFKDKDYYGESYKDNKGHYDLVSAGGNDFIMVYMGWDIGEEEIAWMNQVLQENEDRIAILNFHEYLLVSGNRSPIGDKIFEEVVKPNENVQAVLCGHYHDAQTLIDGIDDDGDGTTDRNVYQMLADYQGGPEGGQGYMRILTFDTTTNTIDVQTYSPYLDDYNYYDPEQYPGKDEFDLEMDLEPKEKVVATDYFEANVYTEEPIKSFNNVKSGTTIEIDWNKIKTKGDLTHWYGIATDAFGGETRTEVYKLTANGTEPENPDEGNGGTNPDEDKEPGDENQGGNGSDDGGNNQGGNGSGNDGNNQGGNNSGNGGNDNAGNGNTSGNNGGNNNSGSNGSNSGTNNGSGNGNNTDSELPKTGENTVVLPILVLLCLGAGATLFIKREKSI